MQNTSPLLHGEGHPGFCWCDLDKSEHMLPLHYPSDLPSGQFLALNNGDLAGLFSSLHLQLLEDDSPGLGLVFYSPLF